MLRDSSDETFDIEGQVEVLIHAREVGTRFVGHWSWYLSLVVSFSPEGLGWPGAGTSLGVVWSQS